MKYLFRNNWENQKNIVVGQIEQIQNMNQSAQAKIGGEDAELVRY